MYMCMCTHMYTAVTLEKGPGEPAEAPMHALMRMQMCMYMCMCTQMYTAVTLEKGPGEPADAPMHMHMRMRMQMYMRHVHARVRVRVCAYVCTCTTGEPTEPTAAHVRVDVHVCCMHTGRGEPTRPRTHAHACTRTCTR